MSVTFDTASLALNVYAEEVEIPLVKNDVPSLNDNKGGKPSRAPSLIMTSVEAYISGENIYLAIYCPVNACLVRYSISGADDVELLSGEYMASDDSSNTIDISSLKNESYILRINANGIAYTGMFDVE